jgi:hypothetical protein
MFDGRDGCTADAEHQWLRQFIAVLGKLLVAVYTTILLEVFLHRSVRRILHVLITRVKEDASNMNMFEECSKTSLALAT